jgi:hypothetical protein
MHRTFEDLQRRLRALGGCLALVMVAACGHSHIPNTRVPDTSENREVVEFVEKYRVAVEERDVGSLLALASRNYLDDMGTPRGDDDIDYEKLRQILLRMREQVDTARYQISYRQITFARDDRVLVDMMYTGWFRIETADGPKWERRLEPHRLVLAREAGQYRILSGM